jgi:hypothetical protein
MTKTVVVQSQQKWEYCRESRRNEGALIAEMNLLGDQGWEMISITYHPDVKGEMTWTAIFKRPSTGQVQAANPQQKAGPVVLKPTIQPTDGADDDFEFAKD